MGKSKAKRLTHLICSHILLNMKRTFALKDDPNTLSNARHKWRRLKTSSRVAQLLLLMIVYYFLLSGTSVEQYLLQSIELLLPNGMQKYLGVSGNSNHAALDRGNEIKISE